MESTRQGQHVNIRWRPFVKEPKLLIRLFIHTLLRNGVHLAKKFETYDNKGLKLLTSLGLYFSHLNEHKCRHGFKDTVDPMRKCGLVTETTLNFLWHCRLYSTITTELLDDIYTVASSLTNYPDEKHPLEWIRIF